MKDSLRSRIESIYTNLQKRELQLTQYIADYKENEKWEAAMKCDIKLKQVQLFITNLAEALS